VVLAACMLKLVTERLAEVKLTGKEIPGREKK